MKKNREDEIIDAHKGLNTHKDNNNKDRYEQLPCNPFDECCIVYFPSPLILWCSFVGGLESVDCEAENGGGLAQIQPSNQENRD